ncbi:MAG: hypothetical protein NTZ74_09300 [Chloroflexi bacterium]|nr:hypothetical protein [Chloroflexota bacterium]
MKRNNQIRVISALLIGIIFSGCATRITSDVQTPLTMTNTQQPTVISTITPIPTSTFTPTPIPVSMQEAIEKGSFSEVEFFGKGAIHKSLFSPDGSIFVAITVRAIFMFDANSWIQINQIPLISGASIRSAVFSPDGKYFAAGDAAGKVTFWNTVSWEVVQTIDVFKGPITSLDISPDNLSFVSIGDEKELSIWNIKDGSLINSQTRSKNAGPVNYSIDGSFIMVSEATTNNDLTTWSSTDLQLLERFPEVGRKAPNQAFSPFKDIVASYGFQDLIIYNFETKKETKFKDLFGFFEPLTTIVFLDDSNLIIKGEYSDFYYLVDLESSKLSQISYEALLKMTLKNSDINFITKKNEIGSLNFLPYSDIQGITTDGFSLILPDGILDLKQGLIIEDTKTADDNWSNSIVLDNGNIAVINTGQTSFWDKVNQGQVTITLFDPKDFSFLSNKVIKYDLKDGIQKAALSPDGSILATGLYDGSLVLWNVDSNEQIALIRAHDTLSGMGQYAAFHGIVFSSDGALLATSGFDGNIKIWSMADLVEIKSVRGNNPVFSHNGQYLAYTLFDNRIQVVPTLEQVYPITFDGGYSAVTKLLFSEDGSVLLSGGFPGVIKVWSIKDNSLVAELPQYTGVSTFTLDPKEERLYISTYDGVISIWGNNPK